jgi:hypothetical protein
MKNASPRLAPVPEEEDTVLIGDKPRSYQTFIDVLKEKYDLEQDTLAQFRDGEFRTQIQSKYVDARLIKEVAPYVSPLIKKPQQLVVDQETFYVANDLNTNTDYMCMPKVLMIDVDSYKNENGDDIQIEAILPHCMCQVDGVIASWKPSEECDVSQPHSTTWHLHKCKYVKPSTKKSSSPPPCTFRYRVFKSRAGWHAFLISHEMHYRDDRAIQLMIEAKTDYFYTIFTYLRGWCVRLNRKKGESQEIVCDKGLYPYLFDVIRGTTVPRTSRLVTPLAGAEKLIDLHITLAQMAVDHPPVF